jgi:cardiolipin synthase
MISKNIVDILEGKMNNIDWRDITKAPNLMSIFRIVLIPVFLVIIFTMGLEAGKYYIFLVLALSWLTDILDGYVARRFKMVTELGKILDPFADKLTQIAILLALWLEKAVPGIIFGIIFAKESIMIIGGIYLKKVIKTNIIPANRWGKAATGCFYVSVALLILEIPYAIYGIYLTVVLMIIAFVTYSRILWGMLQERR